MPAGVTLPPVADIFDSTFFHGSARDPTDIDYDNWFEDLMVKWLAGRSDNATPFLRHEMKATMMAITHWDSDALRTRLGNIRAQIIAIRAKARQYKELETTHGAEGGLFFVLHGRSCL